MINNSLCVYKEEHKEELASFGVPGIFASSAARLKGFVFVTSLTFPKFYLRASSYTFLEADRGRTQTGSSTEAFLLPAAVPRVYNERLVLLLSHLHILEVMSFPPQLLGCAEDQQQQGLSFKQGRSCCDSDTGECTLELHVPLSDAKQPFSVF